MPKPPKGYQALRKGRHSEPGARYFLTFDTEHRSQALCSEPVLRSFVRTLKEAEADNVLSLHAFTLMPDHLHLLIRLGEKLVLGKAVSRLKSLTLHAAKPTLIHWQSGYHDHKLRKDEELHPILHYIYMNPYRAKLIPADKTWPYLHVHHDIWSWFQPLLDQDCPNPDWLDG